MQQTEQETAGGIAITVNGEAQSRGERTLAELVEALGYSGRRIATAVNGEFVAAGERAALTLSRGDSVEIVAPRQGG